MRSRIDRAISLAETISREGKTLQNALLKPSKSQYDASKKTIFLNNERIAREVAKGAEPSFFPDFKKLEFRLRSLETSQAMIKREYHRRIDKLEEEFENIAKTIKRLDRTVTDFLKKQNKRTARRPSKYNLFLKEKMSQGVSLVDAAKAWRVSKVNISGSSPAASTEAEWRATSKQP